MLMVGYSSCFAAIEQIVETGWYIALIAVYLIDP